MSQAVLGGHSKQFVVPASSEQCPTLQLKTRNGFAGLCSEDSRDDVWLAGDSSLDGLRKARGAQPVGSGEPMVLGTTTGCGSLEVPSLPQSRGYGWPPDPV